CVIELENQVLGEIIPIVGTPYTLNYRSDRVPGRVKGLNISLSGTSVPPSLVSIGLQVSVAGQTHQFKFPAAPNQQTTFVWDGRDAYGRPVQGGQVASAAIDYEYPVVYREPGSTSQAFAGLGSATIFSGASINTMFVSSLFSANLGEGITDARALGMGG